MRKRLIRLRHAVDVVLALVGAALLVLGVEELVGEALGHRLLAALAGGHAEAAGRALGGELEEPADRERARPAGGHLDGHLVRRAADAAGADLEDGRERLDRRLELLHRILAGALADDREGVVDDALGRALLAVEHDLVADLADQARAEDGVRLDGPDGCGSAARHGYFFLTPYIERDFWRPVTPAASSVPRTTL